MSYAFSTRHSGWSLLPAILCMGLAAQAQDNIRPGQPVILTGFQLQAHSAAPVTQLFLFRYRAGAWQEVAFQIDEVAPGNSYFDADDGLLDGDDEMVFQPQDGGSQTLIANWIDDPDAANHPRVEIAVTDPLSADTAYFYLFRSATFVPAAAPVYMHYDAGLDEISSSEYTAGFDDVQLVWDELRITAAALGAADILDREKLRISGRILTIPYSFTEDDFTPLDLAVKAGPVRVIRQVLRQLVVFGNEIDLPDLRFYYRSYYDLPGGSFQVDPSLGIEQVRVSLDHAAAASGAVFADPNNSDVPVDGVADPAVITALDPDQRDGYWTSVTGPDWRLLRVGRFDGLTSETSLYYHDSMDGTTADGTDDSGDLVSFGDNGILFEDPSGDISLATAGYLTSPAGLTGPQVREFFLNPLDLETDGQMLADGLGQLIQLWHHPNPDGGGLITVAPIIELIERLAD